jgi:hypothetical protein
LRESLEKSKGLRQISGAFEVNLNAAAQTAAAQTTAAPTATLPITTQKKRKKNNPQISITILESRKLYP